MRCPQCSAEQPGGVTVCGFCGAPMVATVSPYAAASAEPPRRSWRWAVLVGGALAVGLAAGWIVTGLVRTPAATAADAPRVDAAAPSLGEALDSEIGAAETATASGAAGEAAVVRGRDVGPLTVDRLAAFAERITALAAEGDAKGLAASVDQRARYRSTMDDARGRRELDGGKPEILAHWLAPWLAAELEGGLIDEVVEIQSVRIDADPRQGLVVRRLEAGGDVTRVSYPRQLLGPLAVAGVLAPKEMEALDLSPFTAAHELCVTTETMRVALSPTGLRIIEVERVGRCD